MHTQFLRNPNPKKRPECVKKHLENTLILWEPGKLANWMRKQGAMVVDNLLCYEKIDLVLFNKIIVPAELEWGNRKWNGLYGIEILHEIKSNQLLLGVDVILVSYLSAALIEKHFMSMYPQLKLADEFVCLPCSILETATNPSSLGLDVNKFTKTSQLIYSILIERKNHQKLGDLVYDIASDLENLYDSNRQNIALKWERIIKPRLDKLLSCFDLLLNDNFHILNKEKFVQKLITIKEECHRLESKIELFTIKNNKYWKQHTKLLKMEVRGFAKLIYELEIEYQTNKIRH